MRIILPTKSSVASSTNKRTHIHVHTLTHTSHLICIQTKAHTHTRCMYICTLKTLIADVCIEIWNSCLIHQSKFVTLYAIKTNKQPPAAAAAATLQSPNTLAHKNGSCTKSSGYQCNLRRICHSSDARILASPHTIHMRMRSIQK